MSFCCKISLMITLFYILIQSMSILLFKPIIPSDLLQSLSHGSLRHMTLALVSSLPFLSGMSAFILTLFSLVKKMLGLNERTLTPEKLQLSITNFVKDKRGADGVMVFIKIKL